MLENYNGKKQKWLVYQIHFPEQGSEGYYGGRYNFCVAEGNTIEEIGKNYMENVKLLYGLDLDLSYNKETNSWKSYYPIFANRLCDVFSPKQSAETISVTDRYYDYSTPCSYKQKTRKLSILNVEYTYDEPQFELIEKKYNAIKLT